MALLGPESAGEDRPSDGGAVDRHPLLQAREGTGAAGGTGPRGVGQIDHRHFGAGESLQYEQDAGVCVEKLLQSFLLQTSIPKVVRS